VGAVSEPIVFISHHRIKPGKAEELKALTAEIWSAMETEKPQTLMNLAFVNQEGTEVSFMHAFADIEACDSTGRERTSGPSRRMSTSNPSGSRSTGR
jgi:hypothetical protein